MQRIIYLVFGTAKPRGGHKMAIRHVEALNRMGYRAVVWVPRGSPRPQWLEHDAPIEDEGDYAPDDILVIPEDGEVWLKGFAGSPQRKIIFNQNHFYGAATAGRLSKAEFSAYGEYMACSATVAQWVLGYAPHARAEVVSAFADERLFKPVPKHPIIAAMPGKRPIEYQAVRFMLTALAPEARNWRWRLIQDHKEADVAAQLSDAAVFLSLNRMEGLGMTTLEAMAAGCVVAGFKGVGGREYATPTNGLWAEDDDIEACAQALARAIAMADKAPRAALAMTGEARRTASKYSYARFLQELDAFWSSRATKA